MSPRWKIDQLVSQCRRGLENIAADRRRPRNTHRVGAGKLGESKRHRMVREVVMSCWEADSARVAAVFRRSAVSPPAGTARRNHDSESGAERRQTFSLVMLRFEGTLRIVDEDNHYIQWDRRWK